MSFGQPGDPKLGQRGEATHDDDPFAGEDELWADEDVGLAPRAEEPPLWFWRGLALGLALSLVGWLVIAATALGVYQLLR